MTDDIRKQLLLKAGTSESDVDVLLEYTKNVFQPIAELPLYEELSPNWQTMWEKICGICSTTPRLEMFQSVAGVIPIVYPCDTDDFETLLRETVYKNKEAPDLTNMGASFISGKTLRFIVLSDKPYSGIPAKELNLDDVDWASKSLVIRKYHECAHYYTKRYFGSSRNNLHDELIADFCGIYAAFGEYNAAYFLKFFEKRLDLYTKGLSSSAVEVTCKLATAAAAGVEEWSKTPEFAQLDEPGRIDYLVKKELLAY